MIDVSPEGLLREVQAAEAQTERYQENVQALIERYHGPWYYGPLSDESASAFTENHYYEWATLMVPRLAFTSPRVSCKSRRGGSQQTAVRAIRHGVNRWVRDVNLRALQERVVMDLEFSYAVILTTLIQHPGDEEVENPRMWPHMMRVPPENFFWDCFARSFEECQFTGHQWITSKQELLDRARMDRDLPEDLQEGWDLAAVQRLVESDGMMDARKAMKDRTLESRIQREEVVLRDVWVPGYRLPGSDARHNGTLFTISDIGEYVSMPKPYYGPRWGPYTLMGVHEVPNHVVPMSPMLAVEEQIRELNDHSRAMSASARKYKRVIAVSEKTPKLKQQIESQPHDYVFSADVEKLSDSLASVEVAGITPHMVTYSQMMRERLDRVSGISDVQRGNVTGVGTATEVSVAAQASTIRTDYVVNKFVAQLGRALNTVAWFMYHTQEVIFPLGDEAIEDLGMVEPWFLGGDPEEGSGGTYDDLELEIEPYSVGRMSEERRALMQQELDQIILTIAPAMVQLPHVNWKRYLQMRGESAGIPDLDKLIIPEVAQMLAGLNLQMQAQPQGELAGTRGAAGFAPRPATTRPSGAPLPQPSVGGGGFRGGRERPQPKLPAGQGVKMLGGKGGGGGAAV